MRDRQPPVIPFLVLFTIFTVLPVLLTLTIGYKWAESRVREDSSIEVTQLENRAMRAELKNEMLRSEAEGWKQRAIDAELEAAALAEDLDALKPGPGGVE